MDQHEDATDYYPDAEAESLNATTTTIETYSASYPRRGEHSTYLCRADGGPHRQRRPFSLSLSFLFVMTLVAFLSTRTYYPSSLPSLFGVISRGPFSQNAGADTDPLPTIDLETFEYPDQLPSVAWILSFGGSGTSYTILNTEQMSGRTTASNYGGDYNPCLPVTPESPAGPYLRSPHKPFPSRYILTKTHCAGFCMDCAPSAYVLKNDGVAFEEACRSGRQRHANGTRTQVTYNASLPTKAVHLVRHPFDNVVGRMHLAKKHHQERNQHQDDGLTLTDDQAGMVEWCHYLDDKFRDKEQNAEQLFAQSGYPNYYETYGTVPCHAEWFRYIQFHNLAAAVTERFSPTDGSGQHPQQQQPPPLPVLVHHLFYDNYTHNFDETVAQLFSFLDLPVVAPPYEWRGAQKVYADYLPAEWQRQAAAMMRELATPAAWKLVGHYLEEYLDVEEDSAESNAENLTSDRAPQVAWLLSFPNSGTSYTLANVGISSNTTTASNYAKDWDIAVPVRPELIHGPFLEHPDKPVPHYVLTKSHCTGYCTDCAPRKYVTSLESFESGCLHVERPDGGHGGETHYDSSVPAKVVHLIRSPFDNIVARMHLEAKKLAGQTENDELTSILNGDSKEVFYGWCEYMDEHFRTDEQTTSLFTNNVKAFFWDLPCHGEWYRFVQWHNHAIALTEKLGIPVHYLYYEDYTTAFNTTVTDLLAFLELDAAHDPFPFSPGHTYAAYYDAEQRRQAAAFVQTVATPDTWNLIQRYFTES